MRLQRILGACLLLGALMSAQQAAAVSQAGGISLTFPVGARYNALGEAGTALNTDITSMWWNPGGLAFAADNGNRNSLHFMYSPIAAGLANDTSINWIGYRRYFDDWGVHGLSLTYLDLGEQQSSGTNTEDITFSSYEWSFQYALAVKLSQQLGVGLGVKYLRSDLAPAEATKDGGSTGGAGNASGWAIDAGMRWTPMERLHVATVITNFGTDLTYVNSAQSDPMPTAYRLALAYEAFSSDVSTVNVVYDFHDNLVKGDATKVHGIGVEWGYASTFFLQAGYKNDKEGDIQNYTAGFSADLERWTGYAFGFGYASVPQASDLDRVHRFSLSFGF